MFDNNNLYVLNKKDRNALVYRDSMGTISRLTKDISTHVLDKYYQSLLRVRSKATNHRKPQNEYLTAHTVREIHKLLGVFLIQCIDAFSVEHIDPPFRCWVVGEPSQHRRRTTADRKKKKGARTDIIARTSALIAHESTREYCCPRRG